MRMHNLFDAVKIFDLLRVIGRICVGELVEEYIISGFSKGSSISRALSSNVVVEPEIEEHRIIFARTSDISSMAVILEAAVGRSPVWSAIFCTTIRTSRFREPNEAFLGKCEISENERDYVQSALE